MIICDLGMGGSGVMRDFVSQRGVTRDQHESAACVGAYDRAASGVGDRHRPADLQACRPWGVQRSEYCREASWHDARGACARVLSLYCPHADGSWRRAGKR